MYVNSYNNLKVRKVLQNHLQVEELYIDLQSFSENFPYINICLAYALLVVGSLGKELFIENNQSICWWDVTDNEKYCRYIHICARMSSLNKKVLVQNQHIFFKSCHILYNFTQHGKVCTQNVKSEAIVNCARSKFTISIRKQINRDGKALLGLFVRVHTFSYAPINLFLTSNDVFVCGNMTQKDPYWINSIFFLMCTLKVPWYGSKEDKVINAALMSPWTSQSLFRNSMIEFN